MNRRHFIRVSASGTVAAFVIDRLGFSSRLLAAIPGGTLLPSSVPKYTVPLLVPPVMPRAGKIRTTAGRNIDYYEIAVRQFSQQILPPGLPATTVWGYGPNAAAVRPQQAIFHAPSLTIEAKFGTPVRVKWINQLVDGAGDYLPHLLPVDPTLHWANPPGGTGGRDTRPTFTTTPDRYTGPVPLVTHVHGATGVGDESDGYASAWFLPAAGNIPAAYATVGSWYDFFSAKALSRFSETWGPGFATYQYPNSRRAATLWYHDHTLGMTRLNVYAGPAGFYIVRGGPSDVVLDTRVGTTAVLPSGPYEVPIAIQDRSFQTDGSLFYPDTRAFFDGITGPYIPDTDVSPIWNPEFFGNMMMVNGSTWPFTKVEQRRYRLRFLNGCQSRFLVLDFGNVPGIDVWHVGNEGGFASAPVNLTAVSASRLLMGPAERADLIVDFTNVPIGSYVLRNIGPDAPYQGGDAGVDFTVADPDSTGQVLQFRVVAAAAPDPTTPPQFLQLPVIAPLPTATVTRPVAICEEMSQFFADAPATALLGTVDGDPNTGARVVTPKLWMDDITENPALGATEVWEIYNVTADAHPIHLHESTFEVVNRQAITLDESDPRSPTVQVTPSSTPQPPEAWESGAKDTVVALPGQVTRIRAQFNVAGQFVWHCHMVDHEDNEMMRAYRVGPKQAGEPDKP